MEQFVLPVSPESVSQTIASEEPESPTETIVLEEPVESLMTEWPETEPDVLPGEESMLCCNCAFPNIPEVNWCKRCGAPLSWAAPIIFPEAAIAVGYALRNAINQPNKTTLIGFWVWHSLAFLFSFVWIVLFFKYDWTPLSRLILFWQILIAITISSSVLYRMTRNYQIISKRMLEEEES